MFNELPDYAILLFCSAMAVVVLYLLDWIANKAKSMEWQYWVIAFVLVSLIAIGIDNLFVQCMLVVASVWPVAQLIRRVKKEINKHTEL